MFFVTGIQDTIDALPQLLQFVISLSLQSVALSTPLSGGDALCFERLQLLIQDPIALFSFGLGFLPEPGIAQRSSMGSLSCRHRPPLDGVQPFLQRSSFLAHL